MPAATFIRVDLPAPFSPVIAWISPAWTVRLTSSSARIPPKDLEMRSSWRRVLRLGLRDEVPVALDFYFGCGVTRR